jgi:hypothetical protein
MSLDFANRCVLEGACLLDQRMPGWIRMINWDKLSFMAIKDDILGQLFSDQWTGLRTLGLNSERAGKFGFFTCLGTDVHAALTTASELEDAWKEMARQRLASEAFSTY